jgi:hypothetical protein
MIAPGIDKLAGDAVPERGSHGEIVTRYVKESE